MENTSVNITLRKDGRYMGKFIIGCDDNGKAQYQYVYGRNYYNTLRTIRNCNKQTILL